MALTPHVLPVTESDLPAVAAFAAGQARAGEAISEGALSPLERLRWVLLENPARAAGRGMGVPAHRKPGRRARARLAGAGDAPANSRVDRRQRAGRDALG
jgi:hypothetical protein